MKKNFYQFLLSLSLSVTKRGYLIYDFKWLLHRILSKRVTNNLRSTYMPRTNKPLKRFLAEGFLWYLVPSSLHEKPNYPAIFKFNVTHSLYDFSF